MSTFINIKAIRRIIQNPNSRIDDLDIMLTLRMEFLNKSRIFGWGEIDVVLELSVSLHPIDIVPHDFERDPGVAHGHDLVSGFGYTAVAPSTEMEAEGPEWHGLG